jgi:hypothetical protein
MHPVGVKRSFSYYLHGHDVGVEAPGADASPSMGAGHPVLAPRVAASTLPPPKRRKLEELFLSVTIKEAGRRRGLFPGGVSKMNLRIAQRVESKHGPGGNPSAKGYCVAYMDDSNRWLVERDGQSALADGRFIFVTMPDGQIRLGASEQGVNAHVEIAGNSASASYAGTVIFKQGVLVAWTNESGTFVPPAALRFQSGLAQGAGFSAVGEGPVRQSVHARSDAEEAMERMLRKRLDAAP